MHVNETTVPAFISRRELVAGSAAIAAGSIALASIPTAKADVVAPTNYVAGVYTATGTGRGGALDVEVTFTEDAIENIAVVKNNETPVIANTAIALIPSAIIDGQTLNVDTVAGATLTSMAIINAVSNCIEQAGGSTDKLKAAGKAPSTTEVVAGTYQATAHGHHSDVTVEVVMDEKAIESVTVIESGETFNLSDIATEMLPQVIVDAQSFNVDTVAGATFTSRAVASAVEQCLEQAGGIEAARGFGARIHDENNPGEDVAVDIDVVVVGSGMAGLAAALSAQENGAQVAIVEKLPFWGGVSQTVRGYFAITGSDDEQSIEDYVQYGLNAWCGNMKGDVEFDGYPNRDMLYTLASNSRAATKWLAEQGATLTWSTEPYIYPAQPEYYRMDAYFSTPDVQEPNLVGTNFKVLADKFTANGGQIYLNTAMTEILTGSDGEVCGIKTSGKGGNYIFTAKSVVLCTGGFGASEAAVARYAPAFKGETINNATLSSNTGDGIMLAEEIGAAVYDDAYMCGQNGHTLVDDHAMIHPYQDHLTPMSCVYVNKQGMRVNGEDPIKYSPSSNYIDPEGSDFYWAICNEAVASQPTAIKILNEDLSSENRYLDILEEQLAAGNERFFKSETLAGLANQIGIMPNILRYTMTRYNAFCSEGVDEDFAKSADYLTAMEEGPWYAVKCIMKFFCTVGGVVTDTKAEVLDTQGNPIPGLYAAGETSNHGFFNLFYAGARSMTICLVMGKIAGAAAAANAR